MYYVYVIVLFSNPVSFPLKYMNILQAQLNRIISVVPAGIDLITQNQSILRINGSRSPSKQGLKTVSQRITKSDIRYGR